MKANQTVDGWQNTVIEDIGGTLIASIPAVTKGDSWTVVYDESDGSMTFAKK